MVYPLYLVVFLILVPQSSPLQDGSVLDLTHPVNENTINWPTTTPFQFKQVIKGEYKGIWYENRDFSQGEHCGTHTDAPAHVRDSEGGWHTSDIPVDRLIGPGIKIDVSEKCDDDADYLVSAGDLTDWEADNGAIEEGSIVLVHTGRGRLYTDRNLYLGYPKELTVLKNDTENLHFPGIGEEAARLLVQRKVYGVGIDTPSLDNGQSKDLKTHRILYKQNIWGLENVARTDELPPRGFTVFNMVHKLQGGSGGPTRVIALFSNAVGKLGGSFYLAVIALVINLLC